MWYGHAGKRVLDLPFYPKAEMAKAARLEEYGADPFGGGGTYYVHTSLCSTDEGREACAAFEARHRLVSLERRVLPAAASLPWLPLATATVDVELLRVDPP